MVPLTGEKGRFPTKMKLVRGHREYVTAFALNQYDHDLLISGNFEGKIVVQRIPEGGLTEDLVSVVHSISAPGKINRLVWHPYIPDIIVSACTRPDNSPVMTFWDSNSGESLREFEFFEGVVEDLAFHSNCRIIATTSKDNKIRIIDAVKNSVLKTWECDEKLRETQVRTF